MLQCVSVCCSALRWGCSVLQCNLRIVSSPDSCIASTGVAACCRVLQCVAMCCNVLQCVAVCLHLTRVSHLQQAEEYRVKPQRVALCWPCTVIPLSSLDYCAASVANKGKPNQASVCCSVLYSFVLCCSVLQCTSRPFCLLLTHVRCLQQAEESRIKPLRLLACTRPQPAFRRRTGQISEKLAHS